MMQPCHGPCECCRFWYFTLQPEDPRATCVRIGGPNYREHRRYDATCECYEMSHEYPYGEEEGIEWARQYLTK